MQNQLTVEQLIQGEQDLTMKGSMLIKILLAFLLISVMGIFIYISGAVALDSGGNAWLWFLGLLGLTGWLVYRLFTYRIEIFDGVVKKYTLMGSQEVFLEEIQQLGEVNQRVISGSNHPVGINWVELYMHNGRRVKFGFRGYGMDNANQIIQIFQASAVHNANQ